VPEGQELVGVVSLGTAAGSGRRSRRERRSADELVHRGQWRPTSHPISWWFWHASVGPLWFRDRRPWYSARRPL